MHADSGYKVIEKTIQYVYKYTSGVVSGSGVVDCC